MRHAGVIVLFSSLLVLLALRPQGAGVAQDQRAQNSKSDWTKSRKEGDKPTVLHDAFQNVRGDSGKWHDQPGLRHAPPIALRPNRRRGR